MRHTPCQLFLQRRPGFCILFVVRIAARAVRESAIEAAMKKLPQKKAAGVQEPAAEAAALGGAGAAEVRH